MSLFEAIDNYCERIDASFWAEPVNALSNSAFLVAAWLLWRRYQRAGQPDAHLAGLIFLTGLIGVGSFAFHTFANVLTIFADIIPITFFVFYYLWLALRRFVGAGRGKAVALMAGFVLLCASTGLVPADYRFNGSLSYFPCLIALVILALFLIPTQPKLAKSLGLAVACFVLSLTCRSVDMLVCGSFPLGTHFLWHSFNGVLLFWLVRTVQDFSLKNMN